MNGLDLFSGIGGIGIALEPWVRTVAYCERDRYAQGVLLSRMRSGDIDQAPIWDDVTTLRADLLPRIDIIFGGFPCQDLSVAGAGKGLGGKRSGLFYEIIRLVKEISPRFVFLENVPAIRTRGLSEVVHAFTKIGYDCRWTCLSAADVGAPHKRERWFLLAHPHRIRSSPQSFGDVGKLAETSGGKKETGDQFTICTPSCGSNVADSNSNFIRIEQRWRIGKSGERAPFIRDNGEKEFMAYSSRPRCQEFDIASKPEESGHSARGVDPVGDSTWWAVEPAVGRVANGVQNRVDRIKCLGNSVVPLQVREAFKKLAGIN